jgi:hypothetical protein
MKTVFCSLPISTELTALTYPVDDNPAIEYAGKVAFPINAVLAKTMVIDEDVKIILLATKDKENKYKTYKDEFKKELNKINEQIGARIIYDESIEMPYELTRKVFNETLYNIISKLESGMEILTDITYGAKPLPVLLFYALNFAEKFFDADIRYIIYGKVDFLPDPKNQGRKRAANPMLYDITSLYYLNSLTEIMNCDKAETALKMLNEYFSM